MSTALLFPCSLCVHCLGSLSVSFGGLHSAAAIHQRGAGDTEWPLCELWASVPQERCSCVCAC